MVSWIAGNLVLNCGLFMAVDVESFYVGDPKMCSLPLYCSTKTDPSFIIHCNLSVLNVISNWSPAITMGNIPIKTF